MTGSDPIDLLFGGLAKLGPGSDADTLYVYRSLPSRPLRCVVDAGCGTGRQTLALAREIGVPIDAVDIHQPFLDDLAGRARDARVERLVRVHCMNMSDIPRVFRGIDLLWSEGSAYSIGFRHALATWAPALSARGVLVVSELSWLTTEIPDPVKEFFRSGYPDMQSVERNIDAAIEAGYTVRSTHTLPPSAWVDGYYDVLEPRARALLEHPDADVRELASGTLQEIEVFHRSEGSYGYVFYVLQPGATA